MRSAGEDCLGQPSLVGRDGREGLGYQHLAELRLQIYSGDSMGGGGLGRDSVRLLEWSVDLVAAACLPTSEDAHADEEPCFV